LLEDLRGESVACSSLITHLERDFPIHTAYNEIRQVGEDPSREERLVWCRNRDVLSTDRINSAYSYGRILFRDFRNSVQLRLEIADGWEARPLGFDRPSVYINHSRRMLFGFDHPDVEETVRELICGLQA
jgi:hypothetical protein